MNKKFVFKGAALIFVISVYFVLFTIDGIDAFSDNNGGYENSYRPRRITNDYSNLPQFAPIESSVNQFLTRWGLTGASIAVVNQGKLVYARGFGFADVQREIEVEPDHLFRIASVSKLITAVAVMKLKEHGLLSLDDKVFGEGGILDDSLYSDTRDRNINKITVRHLLEHSAGWSTRYGDPLFMNVQIASVMDESLPITTETISRYVLHRQRLFFQPGTRSYYSNYGYMMLGKVIEKISGMTYEDYVTEKILNPLGIYNMKLGKNLFEERDVSEVTYYDREQAPFRLSCVGTGEMVPRPYGGTDVETLGAAGGWIASSVELLKLLVSIDGHDDAPDFLTPESVKEMTTPREPYLDPLGWRHTSDSGLWQRTGTLAGTSALLVRRSDGISWVALFNSSTWKGARFSKDIYRMMTNAIDQVEEWPDRDLFNLHLPPNLEPISPSWWTSNIYRH